MCANVFLLYICIIVRKNIKQLNLYTHEFYKKTYHDSSGCTCVCKL